MIKLGTEIKLYGGGTPSKAVDAYWNGKIYWLSVKDLISDRITTTQDKISKEGLENSASRLIPKGSLIISTRMAVGKPAILDIDTAINQDIKHIKCSDNLDEKYLFYCLKSNSNYFIRNSSGATVKGIKIEHINNLEIPLPTLKTQQHIAQILDDAAALRDKTKQLLTEYDLLAKSIFLEMFGDPVNNPKEFQEKNLEFVSSLITKGSSPKWQGFDYIEKGVRFVTSENVRLGHLDCSKDKFVPLEFHEKLNRSKLKENDLLVNLVGASIGRGALVNKEILPANINQAVAKIGLNENKINPVYLLNLIITPQMQDRLIGNKVEGARANISLKNVRELSILYPSMELQNQFAEKIALIEQQKELANQELQESEALFNSLLQKAFKGELVPQTA